MRIVAIVQARMGSSRLPGKVLRPVAGRTMLARVVRRTARARTVSGVVIATTTSSEDDPIQQEAARLGVPVFRGPREDVLERYVLAARIWRADAVVRITADCPLIDPAVIDRVIGAFCRGRADYASNTLHRSWPRGLDTEVISSEALLEAHRSAEQAYQRVHVTPYVYQHPERFRLVSVVGPHRLGHWRWTVDWPEDLELIQRVYDHLGPDDRFSWHAARSLLESRPALRHINRHARQKALVEG